MSLELSSERSPHPAERALLGTRRCENGEAVALGWPRGAWFETPRERAAPHHERAVWSAPLRACPEVTPHPEERALLRARLEGWLQGVDSWSSTRNGFAVVAETPRKCAASHHEGAVWSAPLPACPQVIPHPEERALLRTRLEGWLQGVDSWPSTRNGFAVVAETPRERAARQHEIRVWFNLP